MVDEAREGHRLRVIGAVADLAGDVAKTCRREDAARRGVKSLNTQTLADGVRRSPRPDEALSLLSSVCVLKPPPRMLFVGLNFEGLAL